MSPTATAVAPLPTPPAARLARVLAAAAPSPALCDCEADRPVATAKVPTVSENNTIASPTSNPDHLGHASTVATRAALFHCARLLLSTAGGHAYPGAITVTVRAPELGERRTFEPTADTTGLPVTLPKMTAAQAPSTHTPPAPDLPEGVTAADLLRTFFSDEERAILKAATRLAGEKRVMAGDVLVDVDMEKGRFWNLWVNLQMRGLIVQNGSGRKTTFGVIPWVKVMLS